MPFLLFLTILTPNGSVKVDHFIVLSNKKERAKTLSFLVPFFLFKILAFFVKILK